MNNKHNIIGIDLSLKSTGITIYNPVDNKIIFGNIVNNKFSDKHRFQNINYIKYNDKPSNFNYTSSLKNNSEYSIYEANQSLKIMMCVKSIMMVLINQLSKSNHNVIVFESHLLPQVLGSKQFRGLSHLIALQHMVRENIIAYSIKENISIEFCFFSPSEVKSLFCGNGKADKSEMIDMFIKEYDGNKLIPDISKRDLNEVIVYLNDIVDSFGLICCYLIRYYDILEIKKKKPKVKKHKSKTENTFRDNLINSII